MRTKPTTGITAHRTTLRAHTSHVVGEKYITAIVDASRALAMPLPARGARQSIDDFVATVDGLLFTSSYSNVRRHHYGGGPSPRGTVHNAARDATGPAVAHRLPRRMPERYPR